MIKIQLLRKQIKKLKNKIESPNINLPLPAEILQNEVGKYLSDKELAKMFIATKGLYTVFKHDLDELALKHLLQAVVDGDNAAVKLIRDTNPALILKQPKNLVIDSKLTWQRFHAEPALTMAIKRGQLEMVKLLLSFFQELERRALIKDGKAKCLAQWKFLETSAQELYVDKLKRLINVISTENFPKGDEQDRLIERISDTTEAQLQIFREELLPDTPITLDHYVNTEQLLMTAYKIFEDEFNTFQNLNQYELYLICVTGFIQSLLPPETANIFCKGLYILDNDINETANSANATYLTSNRTPFYRPHRRLPRGLGFTHMVADIVLGPRESLAAFMEPHLARAEELKNIQIELASGHWPQTESNKQRRCSIS